MSCKHTSVVNGRCYYCNEPASMLGIMTNGHNAVERMVVAFNLANWFVLYASGKAVEIEIENCGPSDIGPFGDADENPDHGIWVWEGVPSGIWCGENQDEFDGYDFTEGLWREPTKEEWACIVKNESPWPSKLYEEMNDIGS